MWRGAHGAKGMLNDRPTRDPSRPFSSLYFLFFLLSISLSLSLSPAVCFRSARFSSPSPFPLSSRAFTQLSPWSTPRVRNSWAWKMNGENSGIKALRNMRNTTRTRLFFSDTYIHTGLLIFTCVCICASHTSTRKLDIAALFERAYVSIRFRTDCSPKKKQTSVFAKLYY